MRLPGLQGLNYKAPEVEEPPEPPSGEHLYGLNFTGGQRPFNNIVGRASWKGNWNPIVGSAGFVSNDETPYPYIGRTGEIVSFPPNVTRLQKTLPWPNLAGVTKKFALTWQGAHTPGAAGTVRLESIIPGIISNVTYAAGRIEFDFSVPNPFPSDGNTSVTLNVYPTGFNPADPVRNFDCREIVGAGGAYESNGLWHQSAIDFVNEAGFESLRFMDLEEINSYHCYTSGDCVEHWADRVNTLSRVPYTRAKLIIGTGNSQLRFDSPGYLRTSDVDLAALLPNHAFGTNGNLVSVEIVQGTGALTVALNNSYDILITLAAAGNTCLEVKNACRASAPIFTQVESNVKDPTVVSPAGNFGGDGSGPCPTMAKTYLSGGYDGTRRYGVSFEAIIELCNLTQTKPHVCLHHNANPDYAQHAASLLKTGLNPECKPFTLEQGNEPWNFNFPAGGWLAAWGRKHAYPGTDLVSFMCQEYARRCIANFGASGSGSVLDADEVGITVANTQNFGTTYLNGYLNIPGFSSGVTGSTSAPYFKPDDPSNTHVGVGNDPAWLIQGLVGANLAVTTFLENEAVAHSHGMIHGTYEAGQHDISDNLADMQRRQRSPMIRFLYGYWLSEGRRRAGWGVTVRLMHYSDYGSISTSSSGAWGLKEFPGQARAAAPKFDAYMNAIEGKFPCYLVHPTLQAVTGIRMVGEELLITIPPMINAETATMQLVRDGVLVGSPWSLAVPEDPTVTTTHYTQVSADGGKVLEFELAMTNAEGEVNFVQYRTHDNVQTIPLTYFEEVLSFPHTTPASYVQANGGEYYVFGAGGRGLVAASNGSARIHGGGGGGFSGQSFTTELVAGGSVPGFIAAEGSEQNSWAVVNGVGGVMARPGTNATNVAGGNGKGGKASEGIGSIKFSGGDGGAAANIGTQGAGGGGAAGPNGNGANGGAPLNEGSGGGAANGGTPGLSGSAGTNGGNGGKNRAGIGEGLGGTSSRNTAAGVDGGGGGGGGGTTAAQRSGGDNSMDPVFKMTADGTYRGPGSGPGGQLGSLVGQLPGSCVAGYGAGSAGRYGAGATVMPARPGGVIFAWRP